MMPMPKFFAAPAEFREWLEKNQAQSKELWVGFHKRSTGKPSLTWPESVDCALSFGWIDGLRKSLGETSYASRFTPRKPTSTWSAINIRRIAELTKLGLMRPAGLRAFAQRKDEKSGIYAAEAKGKAHGRVRKAVSRSSCCLGVLSESAELVSASVRLLGDQRKKRGNPPKAIDHAD